MSQEILRLENITKKYGTLKAVDNISLSVQKGEFVSLLGPSGCGKTTLLRVIAGLTSQDSGRIYLKGQDITDLPPEKRAVNTVFQNYALFPHMTVEKNIGYGLRVAGEKKEVIKEKTAQMLDLVRLSGVEKKYPSMLSGGQKQRVAIARGLINSPDLLLLDEPLGALDKQLRQYLGDEIRRIQKETQTSFIYITHDRDEAMNMSDRMVLMRDGGIVQTGAPEEVYKNPQNSFVASFMGIENIVEGHMEDKSLHICGAVYATDSSFSGQVRVCIPTENVLIYGCHEQNSIPATVIRKSYMSSVAVLSCKTDDGTVIQGMCADRVNPPQINDRVYIKLEEKFIKIINH